MKIKKVNTKNILIAIFFALLTSSSFVHASGDKGGDRGGEKGGVGGGGADEGRLLKSLSENERPALADKEEWLKKFIYYARVGANQLKSYSLVGWKFDNGTYLTQDDISKLNQIIDELEKGNNKYFELDDNLTDPETHKPRVAFNNSRDKVILNTLEWSHIKEKYKADDAHAEMVAIATHEVLQLDPLHKEGTGDFTYTSQLLLASPIHTNPMDVSQFNAPVIKFVKGVAQQATCNTKTHFGDVQILDVRKEKSFLFSKTIARYSWFETQNPEICTVKTDKKNKWKLDLVDLSLQYVFGKPSEPSKALFALACASSDNSSCKLIDFQTLPVEDLELLTQYDEVENFDYRSLPADLRSLKYEIH